MQSRSTQNCARSLLEGQLLVQGPTHVRCVATDSRSMLLHCVAADSQFMAAIWEEAGILPTDPGIAPFLRKENLLLCRSLMAVGNSSDSRHTCPYMIHDLLAYLLIYAVYECQLCPSCAARLQACMLAPGSAVADFPW